MLILNFYKDKEEFKKRKLHKRGVVTRNKKLNRYSLNVNGKNVIVLELTVDDLKNEDVTTLLKIYKGRVLVSESYRATEIIQEYLYNPREYYQRALLSSLCNQVRAVNKEWCSLCVKTETFVPFKELYDLVKIMKNVTFVTEGNVSTERFTRECYQRFGAIVSFKSQQSEQESDVYMDFGQLEETCKLIIKVKEKDFVLYPDRRYFECFPEYHKLSQYNISHNIICSAFSEK